MNPTIHYGMGSRNWLAHPACWPVAELPCRQRARVEYFSEAGACPPAGAGRTSGSWTTQCHQRGNRTTLSRNVEVEFRDSADLALPISAHCGKTRRSSLSCCVEARSPIRDRRHTLPCSAPNFPAGRKSIGGLRPDRDGTGDRGSDCSNSRDRLERPQNQRCRSSR